MKTRKLHMPAPFKMGIPVAGRSRCGRPLRGQPILVRWYEATCCRCLHLFLKDALTLQENVARRLSAMQKVKHG